MVSGYSIATKLW